MRDKRQVRCLPGGGPADKQSIREYVHFGRQKLSGNRLQKKLADSSGLTLIEMLCATIILILLCAMLSTGLVMAANDYRRLTAEAETELLLDTITRSLADKLRYSVVSAKPDGTYSCSVGEIKIVPDNDDSTGGGSTSEGGSDEGSSGVGILSESGPDGETPSAGGSDGESGDAGITPPTAGTVYVEGVGPLLPDGAYGALLGTGERRYKVEYAEGDKIVTQNPVGPHSDVTFTIKLKVVDQTTDITRETPGDGIVVRCLNPVKK